MTGPTPPAINKLKLPSAPGVKWIGLPENAVLHPPHRVQFAIRAKRDPVDRDLAETVETCAKRGVEMVRRILAFARGSESSWTRISSFVVVNEIAATIRDTFLKHLHLVTHVSADVRSA